jgi:hypothetical protein
VPLFVHPARFAQQIVLDERTLLFNQFQNYHFSRITHAGSKLQNASVPTGTIRKAGSDLIEKAVDHLVVSELGYHQATCMHLFGIAFICTVAGNGNKTLGIPTDGGSLGLGGMDTLVRKELLDQVSTQRQTGTGRPAKSVSRYLMSHC